jgi:hypothetical protein
MKSPPLARSADESPLRRLIDTPSPAPVDPEEIEMVASVPSVESPVRREMEPAWVAEPVEMSTDPPDWTPFEGAVPMRTSPAPAFSLLPDIMSIDPPVASTLFPAFKLKDPPSLATEVPAFTATCPATPDSEDPAVDTTDPPCTDPKPPVSSTEPPFTPEVPPLKDKSPADAKSASPVLRAIPPLMPSTVFPVLIDTSPLN